jgi:hypothetical protein
VVSKDGFLIMTTFESTKLMLIMLETERIMLEITSLILHNYFRMFIYIPVVMRADLIAALLQVGCMALRSAAAAAT